MLDAEQFRDTDPKITKIETYCGFAEKTVWTASAGVAVVRILTADPGCVVLDATPSVEDLINQWNWLKNANTKQDGESILAHALGSPVWIHFLRRKEQPCIIFRYGVGDTGSDIDEYPELIQGFFCKKWHSIITPEEAVTFVKSIRIDRNLGV